MICEKKDCTGCFACVNVCPKECISMKEDEFGNVYPEINQNICIQCNLCSKVCPANYPVEKKSAHKVYASWVLDSKKRLLSTSGGLATLFSEKVIEQNGVVYGAAFDQGEFKHVRVTQKENLSKIRGSKYVHSYINGVYKLVKQDLLCEKKVLFIGTPCQVAGLISYLNLTRQSIDKLYAIDIICHGVPSQKLLKNEIGGTDFDSITFRDKEGFYLNLYRKGKCIKKIPYYESLYYLGFLDSLTYRENCYRCPYAESTRVGDITLGDFWGLGNLKDEIKEEDKGISLVLVNSKKGEILYQDVKSSLFYEERSFEEAYLGNAQLREPSKPHRNRERFLSDYSKIGYTKAMTIDLEYNSIINKTKRLILKNRFLLNLIKRIKG